jgi:hypothetical protein
MQNEVNSYDELELASRIWQGVISLSHSRVQLTIEGLTLYQISRTVTYNTLLTCRLHCAHDPTHHYIQPVSHSFFLTLPDSWSELTRNDVTRLFSGIFYLEG